MMLANVAKPIGTFDSIGYIGIVLLLLVASIAIWKWGARYKTSKARVSAVLMIVGIWIGVGIPMGLILFALGLILMFVARSDLNLARRRERES